MEDKRQLGMNAFLQTLVRDGNNSVEKVTAGLHRSNTVSELQTQHLSSALQNSYLSAQSNSSNAKTGNGSSMDTQSLLISEKQRNGFVSGFLNASNGGSGSHDAEWKEKCFIESERSVYRPRGPATLSPIVGGGTDRKLKSDLKNSFGLCISEMQKEKAEAAMQEFRLKLELTDLISRTKAIEIKMIVIHFNYYTTLRDLEYYPAEVGLTAFSVEGGVIDTHWSLIDPYAIPLGHRIEARQNAEALGLPHPPYSNKFQDYKKIIADICEFLEKHANRSSGKPYVCCLKNNMKANQMCLNWLYQQIGTKPPIVLHSFGEIVKQLSVIGLVTRANDDNQSLVETMDEMPAVGLLRTYEKVELINRSSMKIRTWFPRIVISNESVDSEKDYSRTVVKTRLGNHPDGMFFTVQHAEEFLTSEEYAYKSEICCPLHENELADGIQFCALNIATRKAYNALSALVRNYGVAQKRGRHFLSRKSPDVPAGLNTLLRRCDLDEENVLNFKYDGKAPPTYYARPAFPMLPDGYSGK